MMHRYGMDTTRTRYRHGRDTDFTHKKSSIGYDTTQYIAHFEVSVHHTLKGVMMQHNPSMFINVGSEQQYWVQNQAKFYDQTNFRFKTDAGAAVRPLDQQRS